MSAFGHKRTFDYANSLRRPSSFLWVKRSTITTPALNGMPAANSGAGLQL
jgi:hypothetical protein